MSVINSKKHINRLLFTFLLSHAHYQVKFVLFFLFRFSLGFFLIHSDDFHSCLSILLVVGCLRPTI